MTLRIIRCPRLMEVSLYNRQRAVALPLERLRELAVTAPAACLPFAGPEPSVLAEVREIEISVVSDRMIARVHRQFLGVPRATDVITFPHGEIVVSATTASQQAGEHDESTGREVARYIVHGLLHLHGHIDARADDAAKMWRAQERVLAALWPPGS